MGKRKLLIHHAAVKTLLQDQKLTVVDGGGRGAVFEPFDKMDRSLFRSVRFEPDPAAPIVSNETEVVYNKALWKEEGEINLNVAKQASTSSVYPANKLLLESFIDRVGYPPRSLEKAVQIPTDSIDQAFARLDLAGPDFIKLDIHGAEYEALQGAEKALNSETIAVLVEAWNVPVHAGQYLLSDVEQLLNKQQFFFFSRTQDIAWPKKGTEKIWSQRQVIVEEKLYFKQVTTTEEAAKYSKEKAVKLMVLADLYGHVDYAVSLAQLFKAANVLETGFADELLQFLRSNNQQSFGYKLAHKIVHTLNRYLERL